MVEYAVLPVILRVAVATLVAFAVLLTGFRLAARARVVTLEGRAGWLFLGGVAHGSGVWVASTMLVSAVAGGVGLRANLLATAFFLSVASSMAAFLFAGRGPNVPRALAAGLVSGVGTVAAVAVELRAIPLDPPFRAPSWSVAVSVAMLALVFAIAHAVARRGDGHRSAAVAATFASPALTLSTLAMALPLQPSLPADLPSSPGLLGAMGLSAALAIVVFVVVGTGMATALIHRDAEFASQQRLRRLADSSVEGLAILAGNRVVEVNETLARLVGGRPDEIRGRTFLGGIVTGDAVEDDSDPMRVREGFLHRVDGTSAPVEVVARPLDYDGRPHVVYAVRDLSDRRDAELRIRYLAEHDPLTGLPNRAAFQREVDAACAALGEGEDTGFALFCIDLDRFKEANDVFGHLAGDDVLIAVAERLRGLVPEDGFAARLGGDEFIVLARDLPVPHGCGALAQKIVAAMAEPFVHAGQRIGIGASVGVAVAPADGTTPDLLMARADMALYRAKDGGGSTSCFFEPAMDEETRRRRMLSFELREAIAAGQLEIAYQPLADLASSGVTGFEALVRWNHPVHGAIAPTIFVAIAEESGLITHLGEWVLRTVAHEAAGWECPLTVAVNLSPLQLEQQQLPEVVHEILVQSGLSPRRLELEVTESALMRNPQRALDVLRRLKAMGVRIAMDDFGTGYSSLSTLQSFPFDKLKIDRSFVDRLGVHGQTASIVRAVVGLSRSLDIRVVAEGVETEAQVRFLAGEACDEVQGFMFGMPMPIEAWAHLTGKGSLPPPAGAGDGSGSAAA